MLFLATYVIERKIHFEVKALALKSVCTRVVVVIKILQIVVNALIGRTMTRSICAYEMLAEREVNDIRMVFVLLSLLPPLFIIVLKQMCVCV